MRPGTDWKEIIPDGEAAHLEELAGKLRDLQHRLARGGPASRALHAKGQAGVEARFTVLPDLPEHARVGLFARPATYRSYVRFSNGAATRARDRRPDVRGVAIKVIGVPGKKIIPGLENAKTQDFLLIRTPSQPFRNADEFVWLVLAAQSPALLPLRMLLRFGPARGIRVLRSALAGLTLPLPSVATASYYSALPIRYGPYAVRYALAPRQAATAGAARTAADVGAELAARLATGPLVYDFQVQFYSDAESTPIEEADRDWTTPFVTVGELTLPRQDLGSAEGRRTAELVEKLSFDPWHALEEHRPLGNLMRARNHAYRLSTQERGAAPEPEE